jgi:hypothetical protein
MKTVEMKSLDDLDVLLRVARTQFEAHGNLSISIKNLDESLREAQRGLYWVFVGVVGADLGNTKEEQHRIYKEMFLLNIYLHDPENHSEFVDLVENLKIIRENSPEQYPMVRKWVVDKISHMDATKDNMTEYLKEIENHATGLQIRLPAPDRKGII